MPTQTHLLLGTMYTHSPMNASKDEHTYPPTHLHIQIGIHTHTHSLANAVAHTPIQK